ncbi:hypothetical protein KIW84_074954 [Lathyrus oleraceus]|uniref:Uncharacterized protein n=1 Tax=Pisum sativum TaxID=3888 RepID=A0A9D4VTM2_PEA|nr:hypothetical protein KIW84_074954 [Pisum sativum]
MLYERLRIYLFGQREPEEFKDATKGIDGHNEDPSVDELLAVSEALLAKNIQNGSHGVPWIYDKIKHPSKKGNINEVKGSVEQVMHTLRILIARQDEDRKASLEESAPTKTNGTLVDKNLLLRFIPSYKSEKPT